MSNEPKVTLPYQGDRSAGDLPFPPPHRFIVTAFEIADNPNSRGYKIATAQLSVLESGNIVELTSEFDGASAKPHIENLQKVFMVGNQISMDAVAVAEEEGLVISTGPFSKVEVEKSLNPQNHARISLSF